MEMETTYLHSGTTAEAVLKCSHFLALESKEFVQDLVYDNAMCEIILNKEFTRIGRWAIL